MQKVLDSGTVTLGPDHRAPADSRGRTVASQVEEMRQELKTEKGLKVVEYVKEIWFEVADWLKASGKPMLEARFAKKPESLKRRLRRSKLGTE